MDKMAWYWQEDAAGGSSRANTCTSRQTERHERQHLRDEEVTQFVWSSTSADIGRTPDIARYTSSDPSSQDLHRFQALLVSTVTTRPEASQWAGPTRQQPKKGGASKVRHVKACLLKTTPSKHEMQPSF
ncbi:uncharacterized protein LOC144105712 [Amblyomma americanum]